MWEISLVAGPVAVLAGFAAYSPMEPREDVYHLALALSVAALVICGMSLKRPVWRPVARFVVFVLLGLSVFFAANYDLLLREPGLLVALFASAWTSAALAEVSFAPRAVATPSADPGD